MKIWRRSKKESDRKKEILYEEANVEDKDYYIQIMFVCDWMVWSILYARKQETKTKYLTEYGKIRFEISFERDISSFFFLFATFVHLFRWINFFLEVVWVWIVDDSVDTVDMLCMYEEKKTHATEWSIVDAYWTSVYEY